VTCATSNVSDEIRNEIVYVCIAKLYGRPESDEMSARCLVNAETGEVGAVHMRSFGKLTEPIEGSNHCKHGSKNADFLEIEASVGRVKHPLTEKYSQPY
jgi:hypothetical protein